MRTDGWNFEHTYTELPKIFYRMQAPEVFPHPQMVVFDQGLAQTLGLNPDKLKNAATIFAGRELPCGAKPISQAYAGYQFGHFNILGDGRAVLLGEQITPEDRRFDIQLKGSGRTPYSRRGDGLAALSPMLREYIISRAMFSLGIPTTRSLAVVLTGQEVIRDRVLKGAVLTRVASSHLRVGTFDYVRALGTEEDLRALADYCIWRHFPLILNREDQYLLFLREICRLQASLIAKWQLVGFIHGVMNTDNMTISGETIDYGPCAFMDIYDPDTVFSSIDATGRYAYKNQPGIGAWNLSRLAESLLPLLNENQDRAVELAEKEIAAYWEYYNENWLTGMRKKLGLIDAAPKDADLIAQLLNLMNIHKLDYTNTFRALCCQDRKVSPIFEMPQFAPWLETWQARLDRQRQSSHDAMDLMKQHNPAIIPRNHRVEDALAAAESGDLTVMDNLLNALSNPYMESEEYSLSPAQTSCKYQTFCGT